MHALLNQIRAQIGNVKEYVNKGHHHRVIVAEIEKIERRFAEYESALAAAPASPPTPALDGNNLTAFGKRLQEFERNPSFDLAAVNAESAAKLVSDEMVERAGIAFAAAKKWTTFDCEEDRIAMRAALESFAANLIERHATPQTHGDQNLTEFGKRLREFDRNPSFTLEETMNVRYFDHAIDVPLPSGKTITITQRYVARLCPRTGADTHQERFGDPTFTGMEPAVLDAMKRIYMVGLEEGAWQFSL